MAVKQVFETYVYDLGLSSIAPRPFVMTRINATHGKACGAVPRFKGVEKFSKMSQDTVGASAHTRQLPQTARAGL